MITLIYHPTQDAIVTTRMTWTISRQIRESQLPKPSTFKRLPSWGFIWGVDPNDHHLRMWPSNPQKRERENSVGMTSPIFRRSPLRRCGGSGPAKVGRFHRHRPGGAAATLVRGGFGGVWGTRMGQSGSVYNISLYIYKYYIILYYIILYYIILYYIILYYIILYYMFIYRLLTYHRDAIRGNFWTWKVRQIIVRTDEVIHLGDHSCKKHFCVCTLCLWNCAKISISLHLI